MENNKLGQEIVDGLNGGVLQDTSVFNSFIRSAIKFSIKTHEVYQKQKRKGKDIPYITHPLSVGLILAKAGAPDHIIAAGILHDTMEDSIPEKKVTKEMLVERFGLSVAGIVEDVTERDKKLPWKQRKLEALEHIKTLEGPSLWVKSADVINNVSEILDDYSKGKDEVFLRFNAPKKDIVENYQAVIDALIKRWAAQPHESIRNPMISDLKTLAYDIAEIK